MIIIAILLLLVLSLSLVNIIINEKDKNKGAPKMPEIKTYFDFHSWLLDNLIKTNSNNVIWYINFQTLEDLWYEDEEPWVDVSLLVDNTYYSERIHEPELTPKTLKEWNTILKSALDSKSTDYNEKASVIHNAIKTIIESGQKIDPKLIEIRNELEQKGL